MTERIYMNMPQILVARLHKKGRTCVAVFSRDTPLTGHLA